MAFGASNNNTIEAKFSLDASQAVQEAKKTEKSFENIGKTVAASSKKVDKEVANISQSFRDLSNAVRNPAGAFEELAESVVVNSNAFKQVATNARAFASSLAPLAPVVVGVGAAALGASLAVNKLVEAAAQGDRYSDVADAFRDAAEGAGVLSDTLLNDLQAATNGTVENLELMIDANRLFKTGLDPSTFDDITAAAKRYADSVGIEVTQAQDTFTQALLTGRESQLKAFGTVKDGKLILDEFNASLQQLSFSQKNVTDIAEQYAAASKNITNEFRALINESETLKLATLAYYHVVESLKQSIVDVAKAILTLTDGALRLARGVIEEITDDVAILGNLLGQIANGEVPSFSRAVGEVLAQKLDAASKAGEKTGQVILDIGKNADEAGKKTEAAGKAIAKALESSDLDLADMFNLESFVLPGTTDSLRDAITQALKNVNPLDVISELQGVREAFLEGITGSPEDIAAQVQERIAIFQREIAKAEEQLDAKTKTNADRAKAGSDAKVDAGFFGFDVDGIEEDTERALSGALAQGVQLAIDSAFSGDFDFSGFQAVTANMAGSIAESFLPGSGPIASALTNGIVGLFAGSEDAGTTARKGVDRFFADLFDSERLSIVVQDELKRVNDLVFSGETPFGGNSDFASGTFDDFLSTLPANTQTAFNAVGGAFEDLLGVSEDISGQIGAVLANNIGGSLENLQLLVQKTGYSFEQLGDAIFESFFNGELSLQQLNEQLAVLQDLYLPGIPGQFGAIEQAANSFQVALADGSGSRILLDSLRDIGAEAQDVGGSLTTVAQTLAGALGLGADRVVGLLEAMKVAGVNSIQELVDASNAKLAALASNIQQVTLGETPTNAAVTSPTASFTPATNFASASYRTPSGGGGGGKGISEADKKAKQREEERKRRIKALNDETFRLLQTTTQYEKILEQLNEETLTNKQAGQQVEDLYGKLRAAIEKQTKAEEDYRKELEKGTKANEKRLATLAAAADAANESLKTLTEDGGKALNEIDTSGLKFAVSNLNALGISLDVLGVSAEKTTDIIIQGFLAGTKSIRDAYREVQQIEELFEQGIPGAIGAVNEAFSNLLRGGLNGGAFSVDAFQDIFGEAQEAAEAGSSGRRQQEFADLSKQLADSKKELQDLLNQGPAAGQSRADYDRQVTNLRQSISSQQDIVDNFFTTPVKASLEDVRAELLETYDPATVGIFFQALSESGITTFEDFQNASDEAVFKILGRLDELGFPFEETSEDVRGMNQELQDVLNPVDTLISTADGLITPLEAANRQISAFLTTSQGLPSIYIGLPPQVDAVAASISAMVGQLANLQQNYQIGVTFTVDAIYSGAAKEISDHIRDGGAEVTVTTTSTSGPGLKPPTARGLRKYERLKKSGNKKQQDAFIASQKLKGYDTSGYVF